MRSYTCILWYKRKYARAVFCLKLSSHIRQWPTKSDPQCYQRHATVTLDWQHLWYDELVSLGYAILKTAWNKSWTVAGRWWANQQCCWPVVLTIAIGHLFSTWTIWASFALILWRLLLANYIFAPTNNILMLHMARYKFLHCISLKTVPCKCRWLWCFSSVRSPAAKQRIFKLQYSSCVLFLCYQLGLSFKHFGENHVTVTHGCKFFVRFSATPCIIGIRQVCRHAGCRPAQTRWM